MNSSDDIEVQIRGREPDLSAWQRRSDEQFKNLKPGDTHSVIISRRIEGGFLLCAKDGLNFFLPTESVPIGQRDDAGFLGQRITCEIVRIDDRMRNVTVKLVTPTS